MSNKKDLLALKLKLCTLALSSAVATSLVGCSHESSTNGDIQYSILDQSNVDDIENGTTQIIKVPNNDFNLVVNYKLDLGENERWTVTDDKDIIMEVKTENLPSNMKVYIDNIHTDTKIVSHSSYSNGILQDTMDDRIHNSLMLGFPISNDISYIGSNHIEGQNDTFISGFTYGINGSAGGSVTQKRRLESDYLSEGVYANQISSVIDLIIINQNNETSCVSVNSDITIPVWPFVKFVGKYSAYYNNYYYDGKDMVTQKLTEDEYNDIVNGNGYQKVLN